MSDCGDCVCDCTGVDIGSVDAGNTADCCAGDGCDCNCCAGDGCDCNCCAGDGCDCNCTGERGCCEGCDCIDCGNCLTDCCNEGFSTCMIFSCSSSNNAPQVVPGDEQQQRKDTQGNLCCLCVTLGTAFLGIAGVIVLIVLNAHNTM